MQSAYLKHHSTGTACNCPDTFNDILRAIDDCKVTLLILLDLSAAFDRPSTASKQTENETWYISGSTGIVLHCNRSKLITSHRHRDHCMLYGVPQGSVLLFSIYMLPLEDILKSRDMDYHFYLSDTQSLNATISINAARDKIERYLEYIEYRLN